MVISLLHPSRSRPEKALQTASDWTSRSGLAEINYVISVDLSDPRLTKYKYYYSTSGLIINDNSSVVEATNHAAKHSTGDILVYLSDDFKCFDNWGLALIKEFEGVTEPMLLKVDDCLQNFHVPVLTIPIMNRALYNKLGYFFHPDFKSMFCDEHLYWKCMQLKALKFAPHLKFEHCHVSVGKAQDDETYRRSAKNWEQGKAMFQKHKTAGFP